MKPTGQLFFMRCVVIVFFLVTSGCCSWRHELDCPEISLPEHVTEIINGPPQPIMTPVPPQVDVKYVDEDNIAESAEAIMMVIVELQRAFEEASKIIDDHNNKCKGIKEK